MYDGSKPCDNATAAPSGFGSIEIVYGWTRVMLQPLSLD